MVRIVGGIILMKIGFELFSSSPSGGEIVPAGGADEGTNIAFVPLAMPLMCGPGAIATILGMASTVLDRTGIICRHRGSHPGHNVRDVSVSNLCGQTFREIGSNGD